MLNWKSGKINLKRKPVQLKENEFSNQLIVEEKVEVKLKGLKTRYLVILVMQVNPNEIMEIAAKVEVKIKEKHLRYG